MSTTTTLRAIPSPLNKLIGDFLHWRVDDINSDGGAWGSWTARHGPVWELYKHGVQWASIPEQRRTCIQAGGALGMYPIFYDKLFKNVYSFEPEQGNFEVLMKNREITRSEFKCLNVALGAEPGRAFLEINNSNQGMHRINPDSDLEHRQDVKVVTIDSLEYVDVDLIHLDLEGYEITALEGAKETIANWRPVIILEHPNADEYMKSIGYSHFCTLHDKVYLPD